MRAAVVVLSVVSAVLACALSGTSVGWWTAERELAERNAEIEKCRETSDGLRNSSALALVECSDARSDARMYHRWADIAGEKRAMGGPAR